MTALSSSNAPPLNKYLASTGFCGLNGSVATGKKTRDEPLKTLSVFLSDESQGELPKSEMIKLWKGIFYCFWMSDKSLVQQALASELAELVLSITNTVSAFSFLNGFWETMVREWNGIDRLRLDKYLMLVRRFVNVAFRLLIRHDWDSKMCQEYNAILEHLDGPLCPSDGRVSTGLVYHITDVYLEELEKNLRSSSSAKPIPLALILSPFFNLVTQTPLATTYNHIQSSLFQPLLSSFSLIEGDESRARKRRRVDNGSSGIYSSIITNSCLDDASLEVKLSPKMLRRKILRRLFETASSVKTRDANRRKIYALWRAENDDDEYYDSEVELDSE
ncbi:Nop52-domain-containing protein [Lentinula raphanica]|nr:Nop52-domain-containing protein [Lentinula raphanica]